MDQAHKPHDPSSLMLDPGSWTSHSSAPPQAVSVFHVFAVFQLADLFLSMTARKHIVIKVPCQSCRLQAILFLQEVDSNLLSNTFVAFCFCLMLLSYR